MNNQHAAFHVLAQFQKALKSASQYEVSREDALTISSLMSDVLDIDPSATHFADGKNILTSLSRKSPRLALHWLASRGPEAWAALSGARNTLMDVLDLRVPNGFGVKEECMDALSGRWDEGLSEIFASGMLHAMPLKNRDAAALDTQNPGDVQALTDQMHLVHFVYGMSYHLKAPYWNAMMDRFEAADGAHVFDRNFYGFDISRRNTIDPFEKFWAWRCKNGFVQVPWVDAWRKEATMADGQLIFRNDGTENDIKAVVKWLASKGGDVSSEHDQIFMHDLLERMMGGITAAASWIEIKDALNAHPNGWTLEKNKCLFWHDIVQRRAERFKEVLKAPPPVGLGQKSSAGYGIWDTICTQRPSLGLPALKELVGLVPFERAQKIDFNETWSNSGLNFARATLREHPEAWVGAPSAAQDRWAVQMLIAACKPPSSSKRITAIETFALLMENKKYQASLGEVAQGVMWTMNQMRLNKAFDRDVIWDWSLCKAAPCVSHLSLDWANTVIKQVSAYKAKDGELDQEALRQAKNLIEHTLLSQNTPQTHVSRPSRRI